MKITYAGKDYELKYTFNSLKYMEEFDLSDLETIGNKPFKLIRVLEILLFGAINNDPKEFVDVEVVDGYLQEMEMPFPDLFEKLMELLQESDFFKQLQTPKQKQTKTKK